MAAKYWYYVLLGVMVASSVAGDWFIALYAKKSDDYRYIVAGYLFCNIAVTCFLQTLFRKTLFETSINFDVMTTLIVVGMSVFILKEEISKGGIFWGLAALFCAFMMNRSIPE